MPSPLFKTKTGTAPAELTDAAKDLFRAIYQYQNQPVKGGKKDDDDNSPKIKVNEIISKMSFFYEKIRNAVDYKDEHLLRKNAIERILRRLHLMGHNEPEDIAKMLLIELIRAAYLQNNSVSEAKITEVAVILERFAKLRRLLLTAGKKSRQETDEIKRWILNLSATDIEEHLGDHRVDQVIGQHMFDIINTNIIDDGQDADFTRDKKIQIYLNIFNKLFKYDDAMLEFLLFRYVNSSWQKANDADIAVISQHYHELREMTRQEFAHPFRKQVGRLTGRYTIYFSVLRDTISENPEGAYDKLKNNPVQFKKVIEKVCERRYKESRGRLRRGAVRSIIYLLLTKSILVFVLEVPVILFFDEELRYLSLAINVLFPPTLLFLIVLFTSVPGRENTVKIQEGVEEIVFNQSLNDRTTKLRYPTTRTAAANIIFSFLYAVTFLISFGLVIWGLVSLQFNIVSILIFLLFLSFVSFFGIRLSRFARAYSVIESRENVFSFFANFFYVPIVGTGKWLTETFSQINVFIFILDFIIESPFKIFVEIFEKWSAYVKERKDEVVD